MGVRVPSWVLSSLCEDVGAALFRIKRDAPFGVITSLKGKADQ